MKATVYLSDGTIEVFGNVLDLRVDGESFILMINQGDEHANVRQKQYKCGAWKKYEVEMVSPVDYDTYPADAKVLR